MKEIMNEKKTLHYYRTVNKDKVTDLELAEYSTDLETWAEFAHRKNLFYQVTILDNNNQPFANIVFNDCAIVEFLNKDHRKFLSYTFHIVDKKYFMDKVHYWEYIGDSMEYSKSVIVDELYLISPSGEIKTTVKNKSEDTWNVMEEKFTDIDVKFNWEPFPEFGQYENLAKMDRWPNDHPLKNILPKVIWEK